MAGGLALGWEPVVLRVLLVSVGVGAVYGGIGLMRDGMGMPLDRLEGMPVDTCAWPGAALLLTVATAWIRRSTHSG